MKSRKIINITLFNEVVQISFRSNSKQCKYTREHPCQKLVSQQLHDLVKL